jgi:hypothetical protein
VNVLLQTTRFQPRLEDFCETALGHMSVLVEAARAEASEPAKSADATQQNLSKLAACMEALRRNRDEERFQQIRRPFDDAFFALDRRTLAVTEDADAQAERARIRIDGLNRARRAA